MTEKLLLPKFSPIRIVAWGALLGLLLATLLTYLSLQQPWLGIQVSFEANSDVLKVSRVIPDSPADGELQAGDEITAFQAGDKIIVVSPLHNIEEPAVLPTYDAHNAFLHAQDDLAALLANDLVIVHLKNKTVHLFPELHRPLSSLPLVNYWLVMVIAFTALIVGLNVWSFRRGEVISRILIVTGTSFFIGALFNAITLSRELALPGDFYFTVSSISHLGVILFAFSTMALLWHYPRRISHFPATLFIYVSAVLVWVNQTWQIILMPFHAYYFHFMVDFIFLSAFAIRQWHQARDSAVDQAALQWLLVTLLLSLGIIVAFFYMPTIYAEQPLIPTGAAYFSALLVFLGLTLGIIKFRLFNISHVWMEAWVWLIGGSILLLVDLALIYLLEIASGFAFALSAIIVGWIYFPARQWISINLLKLQPRSIEHYFPLLIEKLVTIETSQGLHEKWQEIVNDIFQPLDIKCIPEPLGKVTIQDNGVMLLVPSLDNQQSLSLYYRDHGRKLYTPNDIKICKGIFELAKYTANIKQAHEQGASIERKRIARDLHDDIAAQLLTLIHQSNDLNVTQKARQILGTLRETIYSLDVEAEVDVRTALDELFETVHERAKLADIKLDWDVEKFHLDQALTPRQHINLKRIVQELISNIIKHADASQVTVFVRVSNTQLQLQLCDDGIGGDIDSWIAGKGLNNIRTRIEEINGSVSWHHNAKSGINENRQGCCINLQFPL